MKSKRKLNNSHDTPEINPANSAAAFWGLPAEGNAPPMEELERIHHYLYEQYKANRYGSPLKERLKNTYYRLKPLLPRSFQIAMRTHWRKQVQDRYSFPKWPEETVLLDYLNDCARQYSPKHEQFPQTPFWPDKILSVAVATHDVEGEEGLTNIPKLAKMEAELGIPALFNFVPYKSRPDRGLIDDLRSMGHEIGVHGYNHDGNLFRDEKTFLERLPEIRRFADLWQAKGFRSPATHRHSLWMQKLPFLYDTSYFDTDPYEVQPGGCCSLFPFFLGRLVELPYTLPQDHTVYEILQENTLDIWYKKAEFVIRNRGMLLWIVHPDYLFTGNRFEQYREFLQWLKSREDILYLSPERVASHWRDRAIQGGWLKKPDVE